MKKRLFALFLVLLLILCCSCRQATQEGYRLFRSSPLGFSVEYPQYWEKASDLKEKVAVFVTPMEGYSDEFLEKVSIQKIDAGDDADAFNEYVTGYTADLPKKIHNFKMVSEQETTLGGEKAYQLIYESSSDDGKETFRFLQIFARHGNSFYTVIYQADFVSFEYFLPYVETMLSTFTYLK